MAQFISTEFIQQAILTLEENTSKIKKCFDELEEDELWKRPNQSSNSIGNIILHLCGNITQYILSSLGNTEDRRERDKEFSASEGFSRQELISKLELTVTQAIQVIKNTAEDELLRVRTVQVYKRSGIAIIFHVAEHYSYHTGQVIFWTKLLKDKDLGFYAHLNSTPKNQL